jgi:hypothetical protein
MRTVGVVGLTLIRTPADLAALDLDGRSSAFFLGCREDEYLAFHFPPGSVVVDPWHVVEPCDGVEVRPIGESG